jgi:hypothetical protein
VRQSSRRTLTECCVHVPLSASLPTPAADKLDRTGQLSFAEFKKTLDQLAQVRYP